MSFHDDDMSSLLPENEESQQLAWALCRNPQTFTGKLLGGFCALSGVFILSLPIPIVVSSFANYYKNRLWRNEVAFKKDARRKQLKVSSLIVNTLLQNIPQIP
jgi:hypothetical protein